MSKLLAFDAHRVQVRTIQRERTSVHGNHKNLTIKWANEKCFCCCIRSCCLPCAIIHLIIIEKRSKLVFIVLRLWCYDDIVCRISISNSNINVRFHFSFVIFRWFFVSRGNRHGGLLHSQRRFTRRIDYVHQLYTICSIMKHSHWISCLHRKLFDQ